VTGTMGPYITRVVYTNNFGVHGPTTFVYHAMRTNFPVISKGAKVLINGQSYTTDVSSTIGMIYLPGNLTNTVHVNDTLTRIENTNEVIDLQQIYMSAMNGYIGSPVTHVVYTNDFGGHGPHTTVYHAMSNGFMTVSNGAQVVINRQAYTTDVDSTVGYIHLYGDLTGTLKVGDGLTSISNSPASSIVYDQWTIDKRYEFDTEPVVVTNLGVMAFVRAKPGNSSAPVVIHLVDYLNNGAFNITLRPGRFFNADLKITVLRPNANPVVSYYSNLDTLQVAVPDLDPLGTGIDSWGMLVVEPQ
jgi:hypothetical protein